MLVPPATDTVNVAVLPSTTVNGPATDTVNASSSVMVPVAVAVPSDTPAGRFEPVSVTMNVSSASASESPSVVTVSVCDAVEPAPKVTVPDDTAV